MKYPALFLDRDGIINVDHGYVYKVENFEFNEGIFELINLFSSAGYLVFIVTNQSGIGRGYYEEDDFIKLTQWMTEILKKNGIEIEKVYYCPHSPEEKCTCRKPNTGMIDNAISEYPIDLSHSWMIGDKQSDIDLAIKAQIPQSIAIGKASIQGATYFFPSIEKCKRFLEENTDIITHG